MQVGTAVKREPGLAAGGTTQSDAFTSLIDVSNLPDGAYVSAATRRAVRDLTTSITLRRIREAFQEQGFEPVAVRPGTEADTSERRTLTDSYLAGIDWRDLHQVCRAIQVFDELVSAFLEDGDPDGKPIHRLRNALSRDGYVLTEEGRIAETRLVELTNGAAGVLDIDAVEAQLRRLRNIGGSDPSLAIGSAKELIESTAKVVLREVSGTVNDRMSLPDLIKSAQKALLLHPSQHTPGPDGTDAIKSILGGLAGVAVGVGELRNRGYGTGHGMASLPVGLGPRHARLASGAAVTWCQFMLDTLVDPAAPWRTIRE